MLLKNQLKSLKIKGVLNVGIKIEIDNKFEIGQWVQPKDMQGYPANIINDSKLFVEGIQVDIGLDGYINWLYSLVSPTRTHRIYFGTAHEIYIGLGIKKEN